MAGGEGSLKIESDVEIVTERVALSERSVAPFPSPVAAAISFWHGGRVHVCGGHASYPTEVSISTEHAAYLFKTCGEAWSISHLFSSPSAIIKAPMFFTS